MVTHWKGNKISSLIESQCAMMDTLKNDGCTSVRGRIFARHRDIRGRSEKNIYSLQMKHKYYIKSIYYIVGKDIKTPLMRHLLEAGLPEKSSYPKLMLEF